MKKRVMIQMPISQGMREVFEARADIACERFTDVSEENLLRHIADYHAAILGVAPFTARIIEQAKQLQIVSRFGVGYDAVDVEALTRAGIPLTVVGTANSVTVAEHSLFLILALAKRCLIYNREVRQGNWNIRFEVPAYDIAGRKVLVLGFGRIGRRLVSRLVAMEMQVLVYDPYVLQDAISCAGATPVDDWRAVLPDIDFLSVNCPKNAETTGMVGGAELAAMKPTAFVVNTARGGIVDETALYHALKENVIAGAGIDPFVVEPAPPDTPLFELDNIIVSPHSAGVTEESLYRMGYWAAKNVVDCFDGKLNPDNVINKEVLAS
jgi:D-3-phosphoglycerate dehydrogenase